VKTVAHIRKPVLLLLFNRPNLTRLVVEAISKLNPTLVYIACDGPRVGNSQDIDAVSQVRHIASAGFNDCQTYHLYQDTNLGCRRAVSLAVSWFFDNVEEGIILEDDCLPHPDFFRFCDTLLDRYRDSRKVWCITGDNFQDGRRRGRGSYYFSKYNHIWGWATWRDRWLSYDGALKFWPSWRDSSHFASMFLHQQECDYWRRIFDDTYSGKIDTWDYQWTACTWRSGGLTATPQVNLVTNIGHGSEGTHTGGDTDARFRIPARELSPKMRHPWQVRQHKRADLYVHEKVFGGADSGAVSIRNIGQRLSSGLRLFAGIRPDSP